MKLLVNRLRKQNLIIKGFTKPPVQDIFGKY
jgi:hypothetical protein